MNRRPSKTRSEWIEIFKNWEESGLTQKEYCDANDLSFHTFCTSRGKLNKKLKSSPPFSAKVIPIELPKPMSASVLELRLANGTEIRIPMQ